MRVIVLKNFNIPVPAKDGFGQRCFSRGDAEDVPADLAERLIQDGYARPEDDKLN